MATVSSVPGLQNQFVVTLSRGDKALLDGMDRHLVPLTWFDDPVSELADRICQPSESLPPCPVPTLDSKTGLDVFEVALTDVGKEPYEPFFVIPFQFVTASELESEFDCFACYRAVRDRNGNEWEDYDYACNTGAFRLVPEQGTLYVRQRDLVAKRGEVFRSDVMEVTKVFLETNQEDYIEMQRYLHPQREPIMDDVISVKESFMAMYFDE